MRRTLSPPPPIAVFETRQSTPPTLSPCALTCQGAASHAASCTTSVCSCTNAVYQAMYFSCVRGECQPAELEDAVDQLSDNCGSLGPTSGAILTTPFLPPNTNADIGNTSQTSSTAHSESSSFTGVPTSTTTSAPNPSAPTHSQSSPSNSETSKTNTNSVKSSAASKGSSSGTSAAATSPPLSASAISTSVQTVSNQTVSSSPDTTHIAPVSTTHRSRVPAGAIAAPVVVGLLVVALVILLFWLRRRRQPSTPKVPNPFLESESREHTMMMRENSPVMVIGPAYRHRGESAQGQVDQRNSIQESASAGAPPTPGARGYPDNARLMKDSSGVTPAIFVSDREEPMREEEETVTQRLQRVEAQLQGLLALPTRCSPPSYYG
ncbi:hypothetical protein C8R45DRAFT_474695 [Mycena sanguinolenta]|nr:hypothetical protein C8R45DRAFT_474695 [Mycena sanguinolenta]